MQNMFLYQVSIVANELIALAEKTGKRQISLTQHYKYLKILHKHLEEDFNINLIEFPDYEGHTQEETNKYFNLIKHNEETYYQIKDNISTKELRKRYRAMLSYEQLKSFVNTEQDLIDITTQKVSNFSL